MFYSTNKSLKIIFILSSILFLNFTSFGAESGNEKRVLKTFNAEYFKADNVKGLSTAKVIDSDKGTLIKFSDPVDNSIIEAIAGTFKGTVDGSNAKFYCVDLQHPLAKWTLAQPHEYTDSGHTTSAITYILNNYYPFKSFPYSGSASTEEKEAAAIQLSIWHFSDGVDANTMVTGTSSTAKDIRDRALVIIADANANAGTIVPVPTLVFVPASQSNPASVPASFIIKAVDQNNNPLSGISISLTATSGTLNLLNVITNAQGETPAVTLTKGLSDNASVTAVANVIIPQGTKYVHKIQPTHYQQLVLATPTSAMKSAEGSCTWTNYNAITPILECVTKNSNGSYTAHFGYLNENNSVFNIPVGEKNKFAPAPEDRGQVTAFQAGRSAYFPHDAFQVTFTDSIQWSLTGPDGVTRKVSATSHSIPCAEHIYFTKTWITDNGQTLSGAPSNLPSNYKITAVSNLGTATGSYINGTLKFTYTNNNGDTTGLLVDINVSYTVTEENLPLYYSASAGTGTFVSELPGGYAVDPYLGSDKSALHKIINKEELPKLGSLGDRIWIDANKNGIQDNGEKGLSSVTVELYTCTGQWKAWTLSDANGNYLFDSLLAGDYYVKFRLIDNNSKYEFTIKNAGSDDAVDSDVDTAGVTACINLGAGENDLTVDAGVYEKAPEVCSIGNKVWNDINKNGIQDSSETGVSGVTLKLFTCNDQLINTIVSASAGSYTFSNVLAGNYYVQICLPGGWALTSKDAGNNDLLDSDIDPQTLRTVCFNIAPPNCDSNGTRWDIGIYQIPAKGSVGDKVWLDVNKNGIQDNGESGAANVTVKLYSCADLLLRTTTTNASGMYLFDSLDAGSYYVKFTLPSGYEFSPADAISDDSKDSDAGATTGRTICFTLDQSENDLTWDAGISEIVIPKNGSIGDLVWKDSNKNGIQDNGEPGVGSVSVNLFKCDGTPAGSTTTNNNGLYLFTEVPAGSYYVQFTSPEGYTFTSKDQGSDDQEDSDPDVTTGRTSCFTLAAGVDDLSRDAGLQVLSGPEVWIEKDDYRTMMAAINKNVTYTIKYGNRGGMPAYKVTIEDVLPAGTEYVSCNGANSCGELWDGSNTVKWTVGTLNAGQTGQVTLTLKVVAYQSEYENTACVYGQDNYKNPLQACDNDIDIADSCSGGGEGGVESRGDMSELLLKRKLKIQYGLTSPVVATSKGRSSISMYGLNNFVPAVGPFNSVPVETTPFDILGISNALASYAVDYNAITEAGETRVAGIFSTLTSAPYIYDHTKQVCDRLAGSEIKDLSLTVINGYKFYTAKLVNAEGLTDYAIAFSVYESLNGFKVENKWTYEEYKAPAGATNVYNFQVWSNTVEGTVQMVKDIFNKFKTMGGGLSYLNNSQAAPNAFISKARYSHDGNIYLTLENKYSPAQAEIKIKYRDSQGSDMLESTETLNIASGTSVVKFPVGIIADAQIFMSQSVVDFKDEAFVSGGAYAFLTGPASNVSSFNTTYVKQDLSSYPTGSLVLSGGAEVQGELNDWVSVVRSLTAGATAYDLSNYGSILFDARGKGKVDVIIDLTTLQGFNYYTATVDLTENMNTYKIDFTNFSQKYGTPVPFEKDKIRNIGFVYNKASNPSLTSFNFEVTNIAFLTNKVTDVQAAKEVPKVFSLSQNYPNPFNPSTVINFDVAKKEMMSLKVYNALGEQVANLVNAELEPGSHSVRFDASSLASGIYFYKLQSASVNLTRKMILAK